MAAKPNPYWERGEEKIPVVHIFGIASNEGTKDARAGYAADWGPNDYRNRAGVLTDSTTTLRAVLTAFRMALKSARLHEIPRFIIRHRSERLSRQLEIWRDISRDVHSILVNRSLFWEIGLFMEKLQVTIEYVPDTHVPVEFQQAMIEAKRHAGLHSTAEIPITNEYWMCGTRVVDIFGTTTRIEGEMRSGYGIVWGPDDSRNRSGQPFGQQNSYRAHLTALQHALETAKNCGHDEIIIRSREPLLHKFIAHGEKCGRVKNIDLLRAAAFLMSSFSKVSHILAQREHGRSGLREAELMAREYCEAMNVNVSIYGKETDDGTSGVAAFGVYWTESNEHSHGWLHGNHPSFCAEMAALERALLLTPRNAHLTVHTSCKELKSFVHDWRRGWRQVGYRTEFQGESECIERFKAIDGMIGSSVVRVVLTSGRDVPIARHIAERFNECATVRTVGLLKDGNNEPHWEYVVFWGPGDEKNESGEVPGVQCAITVKHHAMRRALKIAVEKGIKKLIIYNDYITRDEEDRLLDHEIQVLSEEMDLLKFKRLEECDAQLLAMKLFK